MVAHGKEPGTDTASGSIAAAFASGMAFLEVSSDANRAIARTMKRAATRAGSEATATNEVEVPHRPDGRECECCKKKGLFALPGLPPEVPQVVLPASGREDAGQGVLVLRPGVVQQEEARVRDDQALRSRPWTVWRSL